MERFIVTIEGPNWTDADELEPTAPRQGEPIETKLDLHRDSFGAQSGRRPIRGANRLQVS